MLDFHLEASRDDDAQRQLGDLLARKLARVDLLGRMQILRHAHGKVGQLLPLSESASNLRFDEDDQDQQSNLVTAGFSFNTPNDQAQQQIGNLTPVTRAVFDGLTAQYRRDAFTLAGVSDVRLIEKIRDALAVIAREGRTSTDFRKAADALTSEAGVEKLNAFSLDTAFQTAMQKAYSAGRLSQMRQPHVMGALPFWQYWTVGDDRVRPEHAVLDGFVALAIDPVWRKIYPPSGFNCRCSVVPITQAEAMKADKNCEHGGLERLPALAVALVPTPGFYSLMRAA